MLGQTVSQISSGGSNSTSAGGQGTVQGSTDSSEGSGGARFILANSVWTRDITLRPEYVEAMQKIYNVRR